MNVVASLNLMNLAKIEFDRSLAYVHLLDRIYLHTGS